MKVNYRIKNQSLTNDSMADVMNVAGKLRWANYSGDQNETPDASVVGFRSESPCKVVVKADGASTAFRSVKFAETEDGKVYLAGPKWTNCIDGEIVRIRDQTI